MNSEPLKLTWDDVRGLIAERLPFASATCRPYGIPRGGATVAALTGHPAETPEVADFIVDDIIDSGRTREQWTALHPNKPFVALIDKTEGAWRGPGWIQFPWEPKASSDIQDHIVRVLEYIGEDPTREGLLETPARVVASWATLFAGYRQDPEKVLGSTFNGESYSQMVCLDGIDFHSTCEHHMLPFFGTAHVAYIPGGNRIVGISKLARLVEVYARRLQVQERLTQQIGRTINDVLRPEGVGVVLKAKHFCMVCRGVGKQNAVMQTSALYGAFRDQAHTRSEFFQLVNCRGA